MKSVYSLITFIVVSLAIGHTSAQLCQADADCFNLGFCQIDFGGCGTCACVNNDCIVVYPDINGKPCIANNNNGICHEGYCRDDTCPLSDCSYGFIDDEIGCVPIPTYTVDAGAHVVCRPAAGPCDIPEECDGTSVICPANQQKSPGDSCSTGRFCFVGETCNDNLQCTGTPRDCSDAYACTDDSCNENRNRCDHIKNDGFCLNSIGDVHDCGTPTCVADGSQGSDSDGCKVVPSGQGEICEVATAECRLDKVCDGTHIDCPQNFPIAPNQTPCNDGLYCTVNDQCSSGVCGGSARDCSDAFGCTVDSCDDDLNTCLHTSSDLYCENHPPAGSDPRCIGASSCQPGPQTSPSGCLFEPVNTPNAVICREAEDQCDAIEYCQTDSVFCPPDATLPDETECDDGDSNECTEGVCESGQCVVYDVPDGELCEIDCGNGGDEGTCLYGDCACPCNGTCALTLGWYRNHCQTKGSNGNQKTDPVFFQPSIQQFKICGNSLCDDFNLKGKQRRDADSQTLANQWSAMFLNLVHQILIQGYLCSGPLPDSVNAVFQAVTQEIFYNSDYCDGTANQDNYQAWITVLRRWNEGNYSDVGGPQHCDGISPEDLQAIQSGSVSFLELLAFLSLDANNINMNGQVAEQDLAVFANSVDDLSGGAIAGIVVGSIIGVLILIAFIAVIIWGIMKDMPNAPKIVKNPFAKRS